MITYRFNCLGSETFNRSRWVRVYLYGGHCIALPIEVPTTAAGVRKLRDPELLVQYLTTDLICHWRGYNISGWPTWAIDISGGGKGLTAEQLLEEIADRIYQRYQLSVRDYAVIPLITGGVLVNRNNYKPNQFINEDCVFAEEPWLN